MCCVTQGVHNRHDFIWDTYIDMKDILCRHTDVFSESPVAADTNSYGMVADVLPASAAIPAKSARNVAFNCDPLPYFNAVDFRPGFYYGPHIFMAYYNGCFYCLLCPFIPLVY